MVSSGHISMKLACLNDHKTFSDGTGASSTVSSSLQNAVYIDTLMLCDCVAWCEDKALCIVFVQLCECLYSTRYFCDYIRGKSVVIQTWFSYKSPSPQFLALSMNMYISLHFLISFVELFYSCCFLWEKGLFSLWAPRGVKQRNDGERTRDGSTIIICKSRLQRDSEGKDWGRWSLKDAGREIVCRPSSLFPLTCSLEWKLTSVSVNH